VTVANQAGVQASIGNGQTLNADAAVYWRLLVAAVAAACGVWVVATEGTRTYARQLYLWQHRNEPGFNPAWHPDDARANHVAGRCVDVGSGVGFVLTLVSIAFYRLAGLYGFRATVPGEPWHFEWRLEWVSAAIRAQAGSAPASSSKTPIPDPEPQEEDDMKLRLITTPINNKDASGGIYRWLVNPGDATKQNVTQEQWNFWASSAGVEVVTGLQSPTVINYFRQIN
jgi:hypothetical protein